MFGYVFLSYFGDMFGILQLFRFADTKKFGFRLVAYVHI